ncbi:MAG: hypothetical protein ACRD1L_09720 [Terriglobales bacterium]
MRRVRMALALLCLTAMGLAQGKLTGKFLLPTFGPVSNGTLLLQLSQAAVLPASSAIVPAMVSCATSTDGSVVGVPNPLATPVGAPVTGVGTLPPGIYFVKLAYTATGATSTLASPELELSLISAGELRINAPALSPPAATGYAVYIGTASGAETLQGADPLGASYFQSSALSAGASLPAANNTVCNFIFNDSTIPSYTYYTVTLEDANGNILPSFPQNWYTAGIVLDVSNIVPLATNPAVRFPMPILQTPANATVQQSLNSGLAMNGFIISQSGNLGPGFFSAFWTGALPGPTSTLATWTPNSAVFMQRIDLNAQTAGSGGTVGTTVVITDGTSSCTFSGLLIGAATASSAPHGFSGNCGFNAGVPLTVEITGDDHTTRPGNVSWSLEMTSK